MDIFLKFRVSFWKPDKKTNCGASPPNDVPNVVTPYQKLWHALRALLAQNPNIMDCSTWRKCLKFWCVLRASCTISTNKIDLSYVLHFKETGVSYVPKKLTYHTYLACHTCKKLWRSICVLGVLRTMHAKQPTIPVLYDKKDCGGKEQYEIAWIKGVSVMIFFQ